MNFQGTTERQIGAEVERVECHTITELWLITRDLIDDLAEARQEIEQLKDIIKHHNILVKRDKK